MMPTESELPIILAFFLTILFLRYPNLSFKNNHSLRCSKKCYGLKLFMVIINWIWKNVIFLIVSAWLIASISTNQLLLNSNRSDTHSISLIINAAICSCYVVAPIYFRETKSPETKLSSRDLYRSFRATILFSLLILMIPKTVNYYIKGNGTFFLFLYLFIIFGALVISILVFFDASRSYLQQEREKVSTASDKFLFISSYAISFYFLSICLFAKIYQTATCVLCHLKPSLGYMDFWKSFYFSVITQTTVGYGDIVPKVTVVYVAASAQALLGALVTPLFIAGIFFFVSEKREQA